MQTKPPNQTNAKDTLSQTNQTKFSPSSNQRESRKPNQTQGEAIQALTKQTKQTADQLKLLLNFQNIGTPNKRAKFMKFKFRANSITNK